MRVERHERAGERREPEPSRWFVDVVDVSLEPMMAERRDPESLRRWLRGLIGGRGSSSPSTSAVHRGDKGGPCRACSVRSRVVTPSRVSVVLFASCLVACDAGAPRPSPDPFGLSPRPKVAPHSRPPSPLLTQTDPVALEAPVSSVAPSATATTGEPDEEPPPHDDAEEGGCPEGMILIHGDHCLDVRQDCLRWMDPGLPLAQQKRCAEFAPSRCVGKTRHLRFCIDTYEYGPSPEEKPMSDVSWTQAKELCEAAGKRLCNEVEWTFACEGEEMLPYPYGLERDAARCNHDRDDLLDKKGKMADRRMPDAALMECKSPFGVIAMTGNVDEWTLRDGNAWHPWRASMKGGWWLAGRNRCRPATTGHDEFYHDVQSGFRCCKDPTTSHRDVNDG